jgi:hypothetical protein
VILIEVTYECCQCMKEFTVVYGDDGSLVEDQNKGLWRDRMCVTCESNRWDYFE